MIGPPTEPETAPRPGTNGASAAEPDELERLLERSVDRLSGFFGEFRILGSVQSDRARLRLRRVIARAQGLVILWIAVALLVAAGTVLVAIGLAGLFRALFADRPWLGDLVAGLVLIGSAAAGWAAHRAVRELSEAKRLERKYADLESKRGART